MLYYVLLLLLTNLSLAHESSPESNVHIEKSLKYGRYCGRDHYNNYGAIPIDEFDRVCQIHDICVTSKGMLDCYCNEQMYWMMSYIKPNTVEQKHIKDFVLKGIYASILGCTNHDTFDVYYSVSKLERDNTFNKGFNYLPIYTSNSDGCVICALSNKLYVFAYDTVDEYHRLTKLAYDNPLAVASLKHETVMPGGPCLTLYNEYLIVYNENETSSAMISYTTSFGKWHPRA